jgi:hypothetical protein
MEWSWIYGRRFIKKMDQASSIKMDQTSNIKMDQTSNIKLSLTQRVKECIDAGMNFIEGAQYVGIYEDGYSLIVNLIRIANSHPDPQVKAKAGNFLTAFDNRDSIGRDFRVARRFTLANKIKEKIARKNSSRGLRLLRPSELARIAELADRSDTTDDERSELKRIQASVVDNKITTVDFEKMRQISVKYHGIRHVAARGKAGWKKVDEKTKNNILAFLDRPDVSDEPKKQVVKFLNGAEDGRMKVEDYIDVAQIVAKNKISKREKAKRVTASETFENALFVACQACTNLDDMKVPVMPRAKCIKLASDIGRAARHLLQLQGQLVEEEEDDNEG